MVGALETGGACLRSPSRLCLMALLLGVLTGGWVTGLDAHRFGCYGWHSCPSDHGTYTCGDLGYCAQCPDKAYCFAGHPRVAAPPPKPDLLPPAQTQAVVVKRAVDGDTLELATGERVRLIGVDTPETKDPRKPVQDKEVTAFTTQLAEGKPVRLEYDQQRKDTYGRTLAYIYLEDGTFVKAEIIKQGYGLAYTRFPFKYLEEFRPFEREAREAGRGLWGVT